MTHRDPNALVGARTAIAAASLAVLLSLPSLPAQTAGPASNRWQATVYRDEHGMPHIVAEMESTAWYALGYEQARDALLWVQYTCKAAKGELTWVRGTSGLDNDMAVKVFDTYGRIESLPLQQRRTLFAPTNPAIQANFYDNCVAFAAGADAYRRAVRDAPAAPLTPERRLRDWLDQNALLEGQSSLSWVYEHEIRPVDIAAQGGWSAALMSFWWPRALANSAGGSYGVDGGDAGNGAEVDPTLPMDPLDPDRVRLEFDRIRDRLSLVPGAASGFTGSNTFAWSWLYCQDAPPDTTRYSGLLGDPHQPLPFSPAFQAGFHRTPNHLWFAHVKIVPPGASSAILDVLGHVPHASATFFTSHNRSVAMGGTLGAPNGADTFLLRLRETAGGIAAQPAEFYSYYHDSTPASNQTWRPVSARSAAIRMPDNSVVQIPYWRADAFGIVLPRRPDVVAQLDGGPTPQMPVIYGERIDPNQPAPRWRVSEPAASERMRYWTEPQFDDVQPTQLLTSPMIVTLRAPIDTAVAGDDMHLRLLRDFWEISHANSVHDVVDQTNGAAFLANVCFVDRGGRTFSTVLSAIPERGDDTRLLAADFRTLDKWAIYSRAVGPVPARHSDDRMFDWQYGDYTDPNRPRQLRYLRYSTASPPTSAFKAMTLQDPLIFAAVPPTSFSSNGPFRITSGFFASACNDMVWGFSRKRDSLQVASASPTFANATVDNGLMQWVLDTGSLYQTPLLALEAPPNQHIAVSRFTRQAERIVRGGTAGLPTPTPQQMRAFVVTPQLEAEPDYQPPAGVTAHPELPAPIRQLVEVSEHPGHATPDSESPLVAARRELAFLTDLWATLHDGTWATHMVTGASPAMSVDLREVWVEGRVSGEPTLQNKLFWYDDPSNTASPGLRWIELPADFPLIDFYWPESDVSRGATAGSVHPDGMTNAELSTFDSLVTTLVDWDTSGPHYQNVPTSTGACLLEMMRVGYEARTNQLGDFGRHWVRLKRGEVEYHGSGWTPLTATGELPAGSATLVRQAAPWSVLRPVAFPFGHMTTLMHRDPDRAEVPYDALYADPTTRLVRTALDPEHVNSLVTFFLQLGGCYIEPEANQGNPSLKLARYELLNNDEARFIEEMPRTYPLTEGLVRLTAVRALVDTGAFLGSISSSGIPPFGQCFRARAYDHTGKIWPPAPELDRPCVGAALRAVAWNEAPDPGRVPSRGFQPKFLGFGGSISTLLAMFPTSRPQVESYYWCTPAVQVMTSDPTRFDAHMNAFATNVLLPTHYDDFLDHVSWRVRHEY